MNKKKRIIIAITGASGSIYAQQLIKRIIELKKYIDECVIIYSKTGYKVWNYELEKAPEYKKQKHIRIVENDNLFDAVASGSSGYESMIIIPCSMGTIGKISSGISNDLISRSADVILKEKKKLIIVPREAPYNIIHLKNMETLIIAGAIIMPASPFFYQKPKTIEELISTFVERIVFNIGLPSNVEKWS